MVMRFLIWWYTDGWKGAFQVIAKKSKGVLDAFSVSILLRTLFEPWKQIKSYAPSGSPLNNKMQVLGDNVFARTFGFIIRSNLIFYATIIASFVAIFNLALAILWPVVPIFTIVFIALGVGSYV